MVSPSQNSNLLLFVIKITVKLPTSNLIIQKITDENLLALLLHRQMPTQNGSKVARNDESIILSEVANQ